GRLPLPLLGRAAQLCPAGLAAAADEDLGLDDDLLPAGGEEAVRGGARLGRGLGDLPWRDRQALRHEERLRVGFLDLHARRTPWALDQSSRHGPRTREVRR